MRQMGRRLWSLALCLFLLAALLPFEASAEELPQITVAGVTLSKNNPYARAETDGTVALAEAPDYNIFWEASTGTLTLQDAKIQAKAKDLSGGAVISANMAALTIAASGENEVSLEHDVDQTFFVIQNTGGSITVTGSGALSVAAKQSASLVEESISGAIYSTGSFQNDAVLNIQVETASENNEINQELSGIQCGSNTAGAAAPEEFSNSGSIGIRIDDNGLNSSMVKSVCGIASYGKKFLNNGSIRIKGSTTNGDIYGIWAINPVQWENQEDGGIDVEVTAYGGNVPGYVGDAIGCFGSSIVVTGIELLRLYGQPGNLDAVNRGRILTAAHNQSQTLTYQQATGFSITGANPKITLENYGELVASGLEGISQGIYMEGTGDLALTNAGVLEAFAVTSGLEMMSNQGKWDATGMYLASVDPDAPGRVTLNLKNGSRLSASAVASDTLAPEEQAQVMQLCCEGISLQEIYFQLEQPDWEPYQGIFLEDQLEIRKGGKPFALLAGGADEWVYTNTIGPSENEGPAKIVEIGPRRNPAPATRYTLTATAGEGGMIEPEGEVRVTAGGSQEFAFTPQKNWWLAALEIDGTAQKAAGNSYAFENVSEDHSIRALFLPYTDIDAQSWYAPDAAYLFDRGVMLGVGVAEFGPEQTTSRGMICAMLWRMEGRPEPQENAGFTDVTPGAYYEKAVNWAAEKGIAGGYGNHAFGPEDPVTREQLAAILCRYAEYKGMDTGARNDLGGYKDAGQISEYALEPMKWANAVGLLLGRTAMELSPQGSATRAEAAALLHRFLSLK